MQDTRTNPAFIAAGAVFLATAGIHALMGGPEINAPIQSSTLDPLVRAVSAVVWHSLTALFGVLGVALLWVARHRNVTLAIAALAVSLSFVGLFIWAGVALLGSIWPMPQWTLFAVIAVLTLWGLWRDRVALA